MKNSNWCYYLDAILKEWIIPITIICVAVLITYRGCEILKTPDVPETQVKVVHVSDYYFEQAVDTLKKYEGYRSTPYRCVVGQQTIGYGHVNRERMTYVSEQQADSILRSDLNYNIGRAKHRTGKEKNQALAIGIMMFSMGESGFCSQKIFKTILNNQETFPKFTDYCYINGKRNERRYQLLQFVEWLYRQ